MLTSGRKLAETRRFAIGISISPGRTEITFRTIQYPYLFLFYFSEKRGILKSEGPVDKVAESKPSSTPRSGRNVALASIMSQKVIND